MGEGGSKESLRQYEGTRVRAMRLLHEEFTGKEILEGWTGTVTLARSHGALEIRWDQNGKKRTIKQSDLRYLCQIDDRNHEPRRAAQPPQQLPSRPQTPSGYVWTQAGISIHAQHGRLAEIGHPKAGDVVWASTIKRAMETVGLDHWLKQGYIEKQLKQTAGYVWTEAGVAVISREGKFAQFGNPSPGKAVDTDVLMKYHSEIAKWLNSKYIMSIEDARRAAAAVPRAQPDAPRAPATSRNLPSYFWT